MSTNILFIFEGEKTERAIIQSLEKHIINNNTIFKCAFAADLYQFFREIESDTDLDTFSLIKERNAENYDILKDYSKVDFAEIYLFFDYDAHSSLASDQDRFGNPVKPGDEKLKDMLTLFDNETDKGKLYISYPMVESLRHIISYSTFFGLTVKCKRDNCNYKNSCDDKDTCITEPHYKNLVASVSIPQLCNINGYTKETWKQLIAAHLSKMNYLVNSEYIYPQKTESQLTIFAKQLENT
jgi:hypothetical protein